MCSGSRESQENGVLGELTHQPCGRLGRGDREGRESDTRIQSLWPSDGTFEGNANSFKKTMRVVFCGVYKLDCDQRNSRFKLRKYSGFQTNNK